MSDRPSSNPRGPRGPRPGGPRPTRPQRSQKPRPQPDAPRLAAYDVLKAVSLHDAYANLVLPGLLREREIVGRDAAFATELTYGTLRMSGTYDLVLDESVDRPVGELDPGVLDVLRLGAHQLLSMRVPNHAAVSATVEVGRAVLGEGPASLVNAVLRRVGDRSYEAWMRAIAPDRDDDLLGNLAVVHGHPRWIVSAFNDALGGDSAQTEALLVANNQAPLVTLVARPGRARPDDLIRMGAHPGRWSPIAGILESGDPGSLSQVVTGAVGVQDEGSQLVALATAAAPVEGAETAWLDLCAGPGGKAAVLAGLADERGASLTAVEPREHRAALVENALMSAPGVHTVVNGDGTDPDWLPGTFDRVIADVPCSGLGALRRRPESRWRRQPGDVGGLGSLQRALLTSAIDSARAGGVVAYVTCSPHLAETRLVVDGIVRKRDDAEVIDARPYFPGVDDLGPGPFVQLWPHLHGTDAMFMALIAKK